MLSPSPVLPDVLALALALGLAIKKQYLAEETEGEAWTSSLHYSIRMS
jgi:hypothetical protein